MARWKGAGRGCEGRRGLYVKGGRARCYLACSRMKYRLAVSGLPLLHSYLDLFLRVFLPRTPSSSSSSVSASLMLSLSPAGFSWFSWCPCEAKSFSARAIVRLLIALGFLSLFLSPLAFFPSYLNLFFFAAFLLPHLSVLFVTSLLRLSLSRILSFFLSPFMIFILANNLFSSCFLRFSFSSLILIIFLYFCLHLFLYSNWFCFLRFLYLLVLFLLAF